MMRMMTRTALLLAALAGCVASGERRLQADLEQARGTLADLPTNVDEYEEASKPSFDGTPDAYVEYALGHDGRLRAGWERWRAASARVAKERRLPMPQLEYGVFVTRMSGPERQRLSVRQVFPWPGELLAGADAAVVEARAMQREFEAEALELRRMVLDRYWELWLVRRMRAIQREQLASLELLTTAATARLEVGRASVADVQQIEVARVWLADDLLALDEAERRAEASLLAEIGAPPDTPTPTIDQRPELERPRAEEPELRAILDEHPRLRVWQEQERASELRVRQARRARAPMMMLGADWMQMPGPESAVAINVGVSVPLWQTNYAADQKAFAAEAAAARAEWTAGYADAAGELAIALSSVRDSARRANVYEVDLVPRAQTALDSLLGDYASGKGELAAILLAQRDVRTLQLELAQQHARHAMAWAELDAVVGRTTESEPIDARKASEQ